MKYVMPALDQNPYNKISMSPYYHKNTMEEQLFLFKKKTHKIHILEQF